MARFEAQTNRRFIVVIISLVAFACFLMVGRDSRDEVRRSRERVLRQNLFTLRSLIQQYTLDKHQYPRSLQDLVTNGYLKEIPKDPVTGKPDWIAIGEQVSNKPEPVTGINDVHSASTGTASDGTAYSSW